jgi:hypothetical protein
MGFGRLVIASVYRSERWAVFSIQTSLPGDAFDLKEFSQKPMIDGLLILTLFVDKPDAIETIRSTVVTNPKSSSDVLSP